MLLVDVSGAAGQFRPFLLLFCAFQSAHFFNLPLNWLLIINDVHPFCAGKNRSGTFGPLCFVYLFRQKINLS